MGRIIIVVLVLIFITAAFLLGKVPEEDLPKHLQSPTAFPEIILQQTDVQVDGECPAGYARENMIVDWCVVAKPNDLTPAVGGQNSATDKAIFEKPAPRTDALCAPGEYLCKDDSYCCTVDVSSGR